MPPPAGPPVEEQSLGELVASVTRDLSLLVHQEMELAKTEITTELKKASIGAGLLGGAGFVGVFVLLFASVAGALGIADGGDIPVWAGFLCIAVLYGGLAGLLALGGLKNLVKITPPQRTIRTIRDDITWAKHPTSAPDPALDDLKASHR